MLSHRAGWHLLPQAFVATGSSAFFQGAGVQTCGKLLGHTHLMALQHEERQHIGLPMSAGGKVND